jgi:hypothetical protein
MFFPPSEPPHIEGWTCVFSSASREETLLVETMFKDADIPAQVLSTRDSSYVFPSGMMGQVYVFVPKDQEASAREILQADFTGNAEAEACGNE